MKETTATAMEGTKKSERTREKRAEPTFETPPDGDLYCTL
jgi:hypothetical protein